MIVPAELMRKIVAARHHRTREARYAGHAPMTCERLNRDGGREPCYVCGVPDAPHCTENIKTHAAVCDRCYDEQATFWELDVLVNG